LKIIDLNGFSLSSPYGDGENYGQPLGVKSIGIVEVHTDAGFIGIGETYSGVYTPELINPIVKYLKTLIIGQNPREIDKINKLLEIPFISGTGLIKSIISAIDIALWDIKGQVKGQPIAKLLNEHMNSSVKVYASGGSIAMTEDEISVDVEKIIKNEFTAYKMRVGLQTWAKDLSRVNTAREKVGIENSLMVDAIMGTVPNPWDLETAKNRSSDLTPFNLEWLEEPLFPEDYFNLKKLRSHSEIPIAMGESFTGLHEFKTYIAEGCVDVIQPDVTHCGGFTGALKIISIAEKYKIPIALHVWGSALSIISNLHLAIASSQIKWLEIPQVKLEILSDQIINLFSIKNGLLFPDLKPGLGVNINNKIKNNYPLLKGSGYKFPK